MFKNATRMFLIIDTTNEYDISRIRVGIHRSDPFIREDILPTPPPNTQVCRSEPKFHVKFVSRALSVLTGEFPADVIQCSTSKSLPSFLSFEYHLDLEFNKSATKESVM